MDRDHRLSRRNEPEVLTVHDFLGRWSETLAAQIEEYAHLAMWLDCQFSHFSSLLFCAFHFCSFYKVNDLFRILYYCCCIYNIPYTKCLMNWTGTNTIVPWNASGLIFIYVILFLLLFPFVVCMKLCVIEKWTWQRLNC